MRAGAARREDAAVVGFGRTGCVAAAIGAATGPVGTGGAMGARGEVGATGAGVAGCAAIGAAGEVGSTAEVGFQFPDDYRDFADLYGCGRINDHLLIWTPSLKRDKVREGDARQGFASLVAGAPSGISDYLAELHEDEPEENPYPMYPHEEGLLAWGNDYSANHFFWLTGDADPNKWPIISWNRSGYWFRFDAGFGDFLVANLTGAYPESTWIVGDERPPAWELVQDWSRDY